MARSFKLSEEQKVAVVKDYNEAKRKGGRPAPGELDRIAKKYAVSRCTVWKTIRKHGGGSDCHHRMDAEIGEILLHMTRQERALAGFGALGRGHGSGTEEEVRWLRRLAMDALECAICFVACTCAIAVITLETARDWLEERDKDDMGLTRMDDDLR